MSSPYVPARWPASLAALLVWALVAASMVIWGLRLTRPDDSVAPPTAAARLGATVDAAGVARLLGATTQAAPMAAAAPPPGAERLELLGVVADGDRMGAALIAVDGQPPRPYRVGARVGKGSVLQAVERRSARLGPSLNGPANQTLQLPDPELAGVAAATGSGSATAAPPPLQRFAPAPPVVAPRPAPLAPPVSATAPPAPAQLPDTVVPLAPIGAPPPVMPAAR